MTYIILHHAETGEEIIINLKSIESVRGSKVVFSDGWYDVKESYEEIKEIIFRLARVVAE